MFTTSRKSSTKAALAEALKEVDWKEAGAELLKMVHAVFGEEVQPIFTGIMLAFGTATEGITETTEALRAAYVEAGTIYGDTDAGLRKWYGERTRANFFAYGAQEIRERHAKLAAERTGAIAMKANGFDLLEGVIIDTLKGVYPGRLTISQIEQVIGAAGAVGITSAHVARATETLLHSALIEGQTLGGMGYRLTDAGVAVAHQRTKNRTEPEETGDLSAEERRVLAQLVEMHPTRAAIPTLARTLESHPQTVRTALGVLLNAGLVESEQKNSITYYVASPHGISYQRVHADVQVGS